MSANLKYLIMECLDEYFSEKDVTISEAARRLNRTRMTIHAMIRRGELVRTNKGVTLKSLMNAKRNLTQ